MSDHLRNALEKLKDNRARNFSYEERQALIELETELKELKEERRRDRRLAGYAPDADVRFVTLDGLESYVRSYMLWDPFKGPPPYLRRPLRGVEPYSIDHAFSKTCRVPEWREYKCERWALGPERWIFVYRECEPRS